MAALLGALVIQRGSRSEHRTQGWLLIAKGFHDFLDRVPIASGGWHAQELLDLAQVTNRFHLPAIQTQDESLVDCNDP